MTTAKRNSAPPPPSGSDPSSHFSLVPQPATTSSAGYGKLAGLTNVDDQGKDLETLDKSAGTGGGSQTPRPPFPLPGYDPTLVTAEDAHAHLLFQRVLLATRKAPPSGKVDLDLQVDVPAPASDPAPVPYRSVQPLPTSIPEHLGEQLKYKASLTTDFDPERVVQPVGLPTAAQKADDALGVTHSAFLAALEKATNQENESSKQPVQTGGVGKLAGERDRSGESEKMIRKLNDRMDVAARKNALSDRIVGAFSLILLGVLAVQLSFVLGGEAWQNWRSMNTFWVVMLCYLSSVLGLGAGCLVSWTCQQDRVESEAVRSIEGGPSVGSQAVGDKQCL